MLFRSGRGWDRGSHSEIWIAKSRAATSMLGDALVAELTTKSVIQFIFSSSLAVLLAILRLV